MSGDGAAAFAGRLAAVAGQTRAAALQGLGDWAEHVLEQSSRIVPIEEGTLQNSGTTAVDAGSMTAAVGYGRGGAAAYAVIQHEKPMRHDAGRSDHYLSDPAEQSAAVAQTILAGRIRSVLS
jgi:hypothetical protein